MLLPHARTLASARAHVAALADQASSIAASSAYERVLLELDLLHHDDCPAIDTSGLPRERPRLFDGASESINALQEHGIDRCSVTHVLALLEHAKTVDGP